MRGILAAWLAGFLWAGVSFAGACGDDADSEDGKASGFARVEAPLPPRHSSSNWHYAIPSPTAPISAAAATSGLLLVETAQGQLVVEANSVKMIRGGDVVFATEERTPDRSRPTLRFNLAANDVGARVNISYLAKGITWAPSYRLELLDDNKLRLRAKAKIEPGKTAELSNIYQQYVR